MESYTFQKKTYLQNLFTSYGKRHSIILIILLASFSISYSQLNFVRDDQFLIIDDAGDTLDNPWAGGFNSVQFSEIDLDLDGRNDLFVFDKTGNRISTFINLGTSEGKIYHHESAYIDRFPDLHDWVLLRDYNCDGKADIFTYSTGGIAVYQNTSNTELTFELETNLILSDYDPDGAPNFINVFVSSADIPAIDDIDNDGDLDILTFSILGSFVEYHKNLSMEKFGNCDSLNYQLRNQCWGFFKENASDNNVTLYDTCAFNIGNPESKPHGNGANKHTGSTLLTLDLDSSKSKELVLGDVSFKNFVMLTNGDTTSDLTASSIVAQDTSFPQNNHSTIPVEIDIFPAGYFLDINNDGIKDLIASPNCFNGCKNSDNVWMYKNDGLDNFPIFNYSTDAFLQDGMIEVGEGAHPVFFDHNSDGLIDILVGNYGHYDPSLSPLLYKSQLSLYENIGTANSPVFRLIDTDYADVSTINLDINGARPTLGLSPTFGDMDGDGDLDMLLGDYNGRIHYFSNIAGAGNTASFSLTTAEFLGIDVGNDATPFLYHMDTDNLIDLVIGNKLGTFSHYKNTGSTSNPIFDFVTDSLGKVTTRAYNDFNGSSNPVFVDDNGSTRLYSGSQNGYIYQFGNIDGNLSGSFSVIDSAFIDIWEGIRSHISLADVTNDGKLDMLVGNHSGGVAFYKGTFGVNVVENEKNPEFMIFPNPSNGFITIDVGENDLKDAKIRISDLLGKVIHFQSIDKSKVVINLNDNPNGVYLIEFTNHLSRSVKKIIKN